MERRALHSVDFSQSGNAAMQRAKHPPVRNKINTADPAQLRAWTRRLRVPADDLRAIVEKVGNSVAAVSKQVELQRLSRQPCPVPPLQSSIPREPAKVGLATLA
jgi:predicted nucleic acid-binding Zn ribbon protein